MIYRDADEKAEIERLLASPLMLAPPSKPLARTAAQRQAAYRARKREAASAGAA